MLALVQVLWLADGANMPPRVCGVAGAEKPGMSWQESGVVGSQTP